MNDTVMSVEDIDKLEQKIRSDIEREMLEAKLEHLSNGDAEAFRKAEELPRTRDEAVADQVNHPDHYNDGGFECIDIMRAIAPHEEFVGFCRWSAFKYLWRLGKKDCTAKEAGKAEVYCRWLKEALETEDSEL